MDLSQNFVGTYGSVYYVENMQKSVQYYKDMFNLIPEDESPEWTTFDLKGHKLCLHACAKDQKVNGNGILITQVKNLDSMVVELKKRGVEFVKDITQVCEGGYAADYRDPSGNIVSLFEFKG